ncbi:MAG: hypothetical protein LBM77_02325 [Spirochaetaceae bacterium]|jgi:nitrogen regulatory protein PII|nr:hypothetical protein [Spirochaetaceae bacterium]
MAKNIFGEFFTKIQDRLQTTPKEHHKSSYQPVVKLIFFIFDWNRLKEAGEVFTRENVRFHFIAKARGTANSEILDLLGIGASDKALIFCMEQDIMVPVLLHEVRTKLGTKGAGAGIAFSVPLSSINSPLLSVFKDSVKKRGGFMEDIKLETSHEKKHENRLEIKNDCIISIINRGFSDEFMVSAKEAGARGGTVINARGLAHEGPQKFFGVSVQEEKDIVLILTDREKKDAIMKQVSETHGIGTKAEGIIFSLPVDQVMSLNLLNV